MVDPGAGNGCIRLPAAGSAGAEYLYLALSAAGEETGSGIRGTYRVSGASQGAPAAVVAELRPPILGGFGPPLAPEEFHAMLRAEERAISADPGTRLFAGRSTASPRATAPPAVGHTRTFNVCSATSCSGSFAQVPATAQRVAERVAIYLDDTVPAGGYTASDLDAVAALFDDFLYPIDTIAFGRESDIDNNGVVLVLLTDQVNALTPKCSATGSVVLGYFFGSDLMPGRSGSNSGEIFYSLVPDPDNPECRITKEFANRVLAPTFIHEFQHMINFNQHALVRSSLSEDAWLNEGLSHYAEELGARQIPDELLSAPGSRFSQFIAGDLGNARRYLNDVEGNFLIEPGSSTGTLAERGANWLFVRWLADHFGTGGSSTALTRALVQTTRLGAANVTAATGVDFPSLVAQWQMANYLDDLSGFTPSNSRLQYLSWNFRRTFDSLHTVRPDTVADAPYPLVPDSARDGTYLRRGVLRAGSGRHLRIIQAAAAAPVELQLTDSIGNGFAASIVPRIGLVRVR